MAEGDEILFRFFNGLGYQNIVVGQSDLEPPDLYVLSGGSYERYGSLRNFVSSSDDIPTPVEAVAPDFAQSDLRARNGTVSFSFLKEILKIFGVDGSAEASAAGDSSEVVQMRLRDVTIKRNDVGAIEAALNRGFRSSDIGLDRIDGGLVHVAYEYLYSRNFTVDRRDGTSDELKLGANVQSIANASVKVGGEGKDRLTIKHANDRPAAIAFKTGKLVKIESGWRILIGKGANFAPNPNRVIKPNGYLRIAERTSPSGP
jgi:hypothetical protein